MKVAIDENLPPALAHAIGALLQPERGSAISIPERLGRGVTDHEWIAALRQEEGWSVLTLDRRLRTRPHERAALEQSGLLIFILAPGWAREAYWPKVTGIVRWLPRLIEAAESFRPPALLSVPYRRPERIRVFS